MKKSIRTCFAFLAIAAICLPLSCIRETAPEDELIDRNLTISFRAGQAEDTKVTKSSIEDVMAEIKPLDVSVENAEEVAMATSFRLQVTEQSLDDELFADAKAVTKGTPVYTENLGPFKATAYLSGAQYDTPFLAEAEYAKENGIWSHTYTEDKKWPAGQELAFFMRYPGDESSAGWNYTNAEVNSVRVNRIEHPSYVTPGSGEGVTNAAEQQQTDFVFATTTLSESDLNKTNKILFYHPFAGVKFKVGDMPKDLVIKSITLKNVIGNGRCVVTPYYGNTADYGGTNSNRGISTDGTKSANCVSWDLTGGARTSFTQTFTAEDKGTTPTAGLFPSDFSTLGGDTLPNQNQLNTANLSKTFILIPQTFDDSNNLTLDIQFEYKGITLTRSASTTATWLAGSLYTYTIKFNSEIDVTITDEVNSGVKNNVVITNTGNVPEYIRAAIVGNWFLSGDIVAPWDMTSANGTFVGLPGDDGSNGKWVLRGRYYYFNKPVAPDAATPAPLFTSYTPVTTAPVSGSHLEMKIMVQAIIADDTVASQSWGVNPSTL